MSCGKGRKTAGEDSRGKSPRVLSANSRSHRPPWPMEGRWSRFSQSGGTASWGRIPPPNDQTNTQNFGGGLPPKFCPFVFWPSPPIGELADGRGGMATDFQTAADRSDRRRLKIGDHPRTRGDVPRPLEGSNSPRDALPPRGARSWAGAEGGQ